MDNSGQIFSSHPYSMRYLWRISVRTTGINILVHCHGDNPLTDAIRQISANDIELWKAFPQTF